MRTTPVVEGEVTQTPRRIRGGILILAMAAGAFGPYIAGSIRTEQAIVYLIALVTIPMFVRMRPDRGGAIALTGLIGVLCTSLFGLVLPPSRSRAFVPGGVVGGLDNLALPVAVLIIVWTIVRPGDAEAMLKKVGKLVAWLAAINGVLAIIGTRTDISSSLRRFWAPEDPNVVSVVAERAAELGRFSGIFNQPAEAGVMYGVGALLTIYTYKERRGVLFLLLTLILIGGLVSVSKTFILVGLPVTIFYLWRSSAVSARVGTLYTVPLIVLGLAQAGIFKDWIGVEYLTRLISPPQNQSLIEFYTSGRFGNANSDLNSVSDEIFSLSPFTGMGPGGWKVAYDSGITEVLVVAGLVGFVFHVLVFCGLLTIRRRTLDKERRLLALCLCVFLSGADFGLPALTANRVATVIWIVAGLLSLAATHDRPTAKDDDQAEVLVVAPAVP
jgi:hypothetical protein